MSEKVYTANGRKENLQFNENSQCNQNNWHDQQVDYNGKRIKKLKNGKQQIGEGNVDGLSWTWITQTDNATMTNTSEKVLSTYLRFKWSDLEGVLGFTGKIVFMVKIDSEVVANKRIDAVIEFSGQWIGIRNLKELADLFPKRENPNQQHQFYNQHNQRKGCSIEFAFSLTPVFALPLSVDIITNFEKTHITDAVLEVEGASLHVNKSFLSIHSEVFDRMFNSNFKEKSQELVSIKDVDFTDFSNFLSLIYPNQAEITVEKVGKYLELADKFFMPAVTQKCEEFLLQNKRMKTIQKIVFADKHTLHKLLRETLVSVDSREELEGLTLLPEFSTLSDATKSSLLHKFMHFIN